MGLFGKSKKEREKEYMLLYSVSVHLPLSLE